MILLRQRDFVTNHRIACRDERQSHIPPFVKGGREDFVAAILRNPPSPPLQGGEEELIKRDLKPEDGHDVSCPQTQPR